VSDLAGYSRETLMSLFDYDPLTGIVTRRTARSNRPAGEVVGSIDGKGYLHVSVGKRFIRLHRLAWFMYFGTLPAALDHINGDRRDNRLTNLRPCNQHQNSGNTGLSRHNTSGVKGVSYNNRTHFWHAQIKINGKQTYLGRFTTKDEAALAYDIAAIRHFGPFARINHA